MVIADGPFAETREIGGFLLVECEDLDEAIEVAAQAPTAVLISRCRTRGRIGPTSPQIAYGSRSGMCWAGSSMSTPMIEDERDLVKALEEQRRQYETLIEVSPIAIITGDPDLIVTSWNPGGERLSCYSKEEAIGRHINDLVALSDDVRDEAVALDWKLFEEPIRLAGRRTRKDGSPVDVANCGPNHGTVEGARIGLLPQLPGRGSGPS